MQQLTSSTASPEVPINENFDTLSHMSVYGKRQSVTAGLTWGYYGGRWAGFSVADGTLSLSASSTNYVVVNRSTGVISVSATNTNWNDTSGYAKVYSIVTGASSVSSVDDYRAGAGGVHGVASVDGGMAAHVAAGDPHPQYMTADEVAAGYATSSHTHTAYAAAGHTHTLASLGLTVASTAPSTPAVGDLWVDTSV